MALRSGLDWRGDAVEARVAAAVTTGINITLARCLALSLPRTPIRTGHLRSTGFVRPAMPRPGGIVGSWGFSAMYAAYVELGTRYMAARPYLRPVADAEYPKLAGRIKAALK